MAWTGGTRGTSDECPLATECWCHRNHHHHILTISTIATFPTCNHAAQPRKSSHLCKSDPSSDEPLTEERQGWRPGWDVWCGTTRLPSLSALAVKCAPLQILTPRAAPSWNIYNWSSQLVLISIHRRLVSWGLMSVHFDPDLHFPSWKPSISPPLYRYRVSSPWQKSVSGRGKCFRKTNEVHVNFLPVFRSNTMYSGYRQGYQKTVKTVIFPKI